MRARISASMRLCVMVLLLTALALMPPLNAQDDFGDFGFGDAEFDFWDFGSGGTGGGGFFDSLSIGGEIEAGLRLFVNDFGGDDRTEVSAAMDMLSASLNFTLSGRNADAFFGLRLSADSIAELRDGGPSSAQTPLVLDEAFVRAFFGPLTLTAGLRKLTWGRADSFGPLDVVNPIDFTDLSRLSDPQSVKIARPMIHAAWVMGFNQRLEAVFVPWFEGHRFARSGRWTPYQIGSLLDIAGNLAGIDEFFPETGTLEYAQAGLRFTTTAGSSDLGFQYFFGRLPRPSVTFSGMPIPFPPNFLPEANYNFFHQIGADFARVISGFNIRAEAGVNITGDLDGRDGAVENPAIVWSLGFDRNIFLGINLNLQGTGSVRLFHDRIGDNPFADVEAGTDISSTRITGILSRRFLRDELELKTTALWGIEDRDFLVIPAVVWSRNDVSAELSAGFFGGDRGGELGQYRENNFVRFILTYSF